jgi:pimeloyl-ACP methyl ester carboxylesterase
MRAGMLVGVLIAGTALVSLPGMASAMVSAGDGPAVLGQGPAPANAPATRTAVAPAVEPVDWQPCPSATLSGVAADQQKTYSCATYRVPIDHGNAALGTIDIALLKRAAKTPGKKIGSLFLNPGGPGGSGLKMPISAQSFLQPDVLDRFDTIGFDPRGVGASNPLRCFTTKEDSDDVFGGMMPEPSTRDEISTELAAYQDYAQFCRTNAGALLDHMSTKDVARDLDTLRAAVGDEKLTYVGFSYGTLIGATYAAMFGKQTRAMVLDGNVDPALRTSDGTRYDRERAKGTEASLNGFLSKCQQVGPKCAFAAGEQPRQKFDELRTYLRQQPIKLPDGSAFDLNMFTSAVAGTLYSTPDFPALATDLQGLYGITHPAPAKPKSAADFKLLTLGKPTHNGLLDLAPDSPYGADDSYLGVNCSDKKSTTSANDVASTAATWEAESPTFGRYQAFADTAGCSVWPAKSDAYTGPWRAQTDNPVLVVGNYHDPATRYSFAQQMASELGFSRLLSVDAFGHCVLGHSAGVDRATTAYLTDLTIPADGQVFQPDTQPFDVPAKP